MIRRWTVPTAVLLAAAATAADGAAQNVTLTPTLGAFVPATDLRGVRDQAEQIRLDREGTLGLGLNLDAGFLRGTLAYATGATITDRGVTDRGDVGDGSVLAVAADLVLRPVPRLIAQPYIIGGAGIKRQQFSWDDDDIGDPFPRDRSDFTLHFGVGADIMLGRLGILAEVTDFLSRDANDEFRQHDAFAMLGLRVRLGGR